MEIARELGVSLANCIYVGNDVNDLDCMRMVGCPVAVADAIEEVRSIARIVLHTKGGEGAIRELSELIFKRALPNK